MAVNPASEMIDVLKELGGDAFESCYQCGLCSGSCPWNLLGAFSSRRLIHQAQLGVPALDEDEIWKCLGCGTCTEVCPREVNIPDIMRSFRRTVAELGAAKVPDSLRIAVKNISTTGNPLAESGETRADWARGAGVKTFEAGTGLLYFTGCLPSYDPASGATARAIVTVLNAAGVDFGILGSEEVCCGEAVRRSGNEDVFQELANSNISQFEDKGVRQVLAGSPHCYHTIANEYPEFGSDTEVIHTTQFLLGLVRSGRLTFTREVNKKVIYHDSCYLGRHNGIYDEPRELLNSIPGVELIEFADCRENSICCGGGSGRVWMETKKSERLADLRFRQALDSGADVLAVACPYCLAMFGDSRVTVPGGEAMEVLDIVQLVAEAL